jgi:hypothetical protein
MDVAYHEVKLFEDHVRITLNGGVQKDISLSDFITTLTKASGQAQQQTEFVQDFAMPSNVFFLSVSKETIRISCYYSAANKTIVYGPDGDKKHNKNIEITMPNVIISHYMKKVKDQWVIQWSKYFCTDLTVPQLKPGFIDDINPRGHIFLFPMSNTYEDAKMCYGNNSMPSSFPINNLRGLDWYYQYLFESPFNDDLGIKAVRGYYVNEWYSLLNKCAKEGTSFPYTKLANYPR